MRFSSEQENAVQETLRVLQYYCKIKLMVIETDFSLSLDVCPRHCPDGDLDSGVTQ